MRERGKSEKKGEPKKYEREERIIKKMYEQKEEKRIQVRQRKKLGREGAKKREAQRKETVQ